MILIQKTFHGLQHVPRQLNDFGLREMLTMMLMVIILVWMGLYPQPMMDIARLSVTQSLQGVTTIVGEQL
ncbi:MAG TPA: hypothetical protein EYQ57_06355 [Methylococcaceae bacterium]|nr:hypothetical protein [Methylococcaceae bacterium]